MIAIVATQATTATAASYHFGVPQFANVQIPQIPVGSTYRLDVGALLPPAPSPQGNVVLPNITSAKVSDQGVFTVTIANANPSAALRGSVVLRALLPNGQHVDGQVWSGDINGDVNVNLGLYPNIAVGSVRWQLVRLIPTNTQSASGVPIEGIPLEFAGNSFRMTPKADMAAVLTRTGVVFVRENKEVGQTLLVGLLGTPNNFNSTYLTGNKVQPIAYSGDLSRVYVGGNGVVYVIDNLTFRLISTINTGTTNIVSLVSTGNLLLIGEGQSYGVGASHSRLLVMDTNPGSIVYNQPRSVFNTEFYTYINDSKFGITGMAIGPDGRTLVVAIPKLRNATTNQGKDQGDIFVFDLDTLQINNSFHNRSATIADPIRAALPTDGMSGKSPQVITATKDPNKFLVGDVMDYNRGLGALLVSHNTDGGITGATLSAIDLSQPTNAIRIDRLDIQRAQSAVLVTVGGVEYAIVSDDNYNFNDPYWRAMFEAPNFLFTPSGPPIAVGGSASAKKVAVGGKLGIVRDPFGNAQFLGATLPLDGYGIVNLSLSQDGHVLLGQLKGYYGTLDPLTQKPHQSHAWNVNDLIAAALANVANNNGMSKHITLPNAAEELIPTPTTQPVGTRFNNDVDYLSVEGRMGDVLNVDVKTLLVQNFGLDASRISGFRVGAESRSAYARSQGNDAQMWLVSSNIASVPTNAEIYSRQSVNGASGVFADTGLFFMAPNLTDADVLQLRNGGTISSPKSAELSVAYRYRLDDGTYEVRSVIVYVTASDVNHGVFFGDRPLENPGYTDFDLSAAVNVGSQDRLDAYRVEQRLRYLGYTAFNYPTSSNFFTGSATANPRVPAELNVNGQFDDMERTALHAFYGATHLRQSTPSDNRDLKNWGIDGATAAQGSSSVASGSDNLDWLNAYNAPHWMNVYGSFGIPTSPKNQSTLFFKDGTDQKFEIYATSWVRDLLAAWQLSQNKLSAAGLSTNLLTINGLTDPGFGYSGHARGNHSIGMGIDLGLSQYISGGNNGTQLSEDAAGTGNNPNIGAITVNGWSVSNAATTSGQLPNSTLNNQRQALRDFLALYALTQQDAVSFNGTWEETLSGTQSDVKRRALFGDGTKAGGLIEEVLIGDKKKDPTDTLRNPYTNMNNVLDALDIEAQPSHDHHTHFHIVLRTPNRQAIQAIQPLVTDKIAEDQWLQSTEQPSLFDAAQSLLTQLQPHLEFTPDEEVTMFALDLPPNVPAQYAQVLVAQAPKAQGGKTEAERAIGLCALIENQEGSRHSAVNGIEPIRGASLYFKKFEKKEVGLDGKLTLLNGPKHGKLEAIEDTPGGFFYVPSSIDYRGSDTATFLAEVGGYSVKVVYWFNVLGGVGGGTEGSDPYDNKKLCPKGSAWKISSTPTNGGGGLAYNNSLPSSNYTLNNISVQLNLGSLTGTQVGKAEGNTITLDDDGGGHGWFIDSTPESNDEFLPTSNPNEWLAKAGSEAAGKMDLLTVLLHEYGHVLGLDHDQALHQLMSEELQPGVRRTVSDEELAAVWNHVSALNPTDPTLPLDPSMPLSLSFFFGFARRRVDATSEKGQGIILPPLTLDPNAVVITPTAPINTSPQYELATHLNVFNGDFGLLNPSDVNFGWKVNGDVSLTSGAAELREHERAMSGLSQAFVLPTDVVALRFEIDAAQFTSNVTANGTAPPDAFEVALLDSVTGLPVAGVVPMTHSDALFNLQSNGTWTTASGVTVSGLPTANGSLMSFNGKATVTINLSSVAAGSSVKLYFDLLGLGNKGSRVVVDNVRLLSSLNTEPVAVADAATIDANTAITLAVLSNDLDPENDPLSSMLVAGPTNGSVTVNANGTLRYTPNANFNGVDSFTYSVTDGQAASNVATVTINITPVNDAPTVADVTAAVNEDGVLLLDLLVGSSDIDGDVAGVVSVTAPQNGSVERDVLGNYRYIPSANFFGSETLSFVVTDGVSSVTAVATVTVTPVNDAPVTSDDSVSQGFALFWRNQRRYTRAMLHRHLTHDTFTPAAIRSSGV